MISPVALTFSRWLIACVVFHVFARPHLNRDWPVIRRHLPFLFALGALGFTAFNIGLCWALNHTTAINVTTEQSAMQVLIIFTNYLLFSVRITGFAGCRGPAHHHRRARDRHTALLQCRIAHPRSTKITIERAIIR